MPYSLGDKTKSLPDFNQMVEESTLEILNDKKLMTSAPDGFPTDMILRLIQPTTDEDRKWMTKDRPDTPRTRLYADWRWGRLGFYDRQKLLEPTLERLVEAGLLKQMQVDLGLKTLESCYSLKT